MKKRIAALLFAGILALAPAGGTAFNPTGGGIWQTVSAVEPRSAPATLMVGNVIVDTSANAQDGYWTTDTSGTLTVCKSTDSWNVHYDVSTNTLTLNGAKITGGYIPFNVGIYAAGQNVSLTIVLQGKNTITSDGYGIFVYAPSTGAASLNITEGEDGGSLAASGFDKGILVQSNSDDAALTIQNADVEATVTAPNGYGVTVQADEGSDATLTVNGGSLTASGGSSSGAGIYFYAPSSSNIDLTVNSNAIVRANGGIASGTNLDESVAINGTGIVFDGSKGTVYGKAALQKDLTIGEDESLTIPQEASLTIPKGDTQLTNEGTMDIKGTLTNESAFINHGTVTMDNGTINNDSFIYNRGTFEGSGTITNNKLSGNFYNYSTVADTIKVEGNAITHCITSVQIPSSLTMTVGETKDLTAVIAPLNAVYKDISWGSNDETIATVTSDGTKATVTALSPGTATITLVIVNPDYDKLNAVCTVTVKASETDPDPTPEPEPEPEPTPEPEPEEPEEVYIPSAPIADGFHEYSMGTMLYVDGKRVKGLYEYEGALYYFDESGFMVTGWVELPDGWYYFGADGKMVTGWLQIGNVWYYLEPKTGRMVDNGLHTVGRTTYYFYDWGGMASDWWYEDENGDWYFFGGSGAMKAAQWVEWKGAWYYLTETGKMAADADIGGYYVNAEGVWVE